MDLEIDRRQAEDSEEAEEESPRATKGAAERSGSDVSLLHRARAEALRVISEIDPTWAGILDLAADPRIVKTAAGERIVHLRQIIHGLTVFHAFCSVRFDAHGQLGRVVPGPVLDAPEELDLEPALDAAEAVQIAARHLSAPGGDSSRGLRGLVVSHRRPRILGSFPVPGNPTLVSKPPFAKPTRAHLVLFPATRHLRLGWQIHLWMPKLFEQYDAVVAANGADSGEILFCRSGGVSSSLRALASYVNPDLTPAAPQDLPQPLTAYPALTPRTLPGPWVAGDKTAGNNVEASWNWAKVSARSAPGGAKVFAPTRPLEAAVVNAFFLCNYLHDFFYLLGLDEAAGALQKSNPAGVTGGRDFLDLRIIDDVVPGDASTLTEADGNKVLLQMGWITSSIDQVARHTAFDAEVLIHEYTHAVTARRVGGSGIWKPLLGGPPQAQAMDEGTSDYFALTLGNYLRRSAGLPESFTYGAWSSGDPVNGRRRRSYAGFAETYQDLTAHPDPHEAGMLWCAALLGMNRRLATVFDSQEKAELAGWLLVYGSMEGIPIGNDAPSFIDGREELVDTARAWQVRPPSVASGLLGKAEQIAQIEAAIREAFAERGMGRQAPRALGRLTGLVNDFTV